MSDENFDVTISFGDKKVETTTKDMAELAKELKAGRLKYNRKTGKWERIKKSAGK